MNFKQSSRDSFTHTDSEVLTRVGSPFPEMIMNLSLDINLAADSAASDVIRLQWAYLLSLLNVGVLESTNHPGFLIFDEPQQQSVSDANFLEMLKFAAAIPKSQIIIATSHEKLGIGELARQLDSIHLWELGDARLITKLA